MKSLLKALFAIFFGQLLLLPAPVGAQELDNQQTPVEQKVTTIVITADPWTPTLLESGKPASVLSGEELDNRLQTTLGETIDLEPGVRSSFFGQGASRPVIRGFGGERVRMLRNGVDTGDVSNLSEDHVVVADPMQASQIEILRGPETLLFGSSAIGGVVNVADDAIPDRPIGKPIEGKLLGQLGDSADDERTLGGKLQGQLHKFNWHLSGFVRDTEDYEIPGFAESSQLREQEEEGHSHDEDGADHDHDEQELSGKVLSSDTKSWGATAGGSYVGDQGFLGISVSHFDSKYGIPGHSHADGEEEHEEDLYGHDESEEEHEGAHDEDEHNHADELLVDMSEDEGVSIDARQLRVDIRGAALDISPSVEAVKFRLGLTDYEHDELEGGEVGTTFEKKGFDSRIELVHSATGVSRGVLGTQVRYEDFSALGDEAFLVPVKTWSPALFAFEKVELSDRVDLGFGGRVEAVQHDPDGRSSENFIPFSISTGPVVDLFNDESYNLGLTFAYAERAPTGIELYADGPHVARQIYEIGDQSLDNESSYGVDLSLRKNKGLFTAAFTPFIQRFTNYLNLVGTGEVEDDFPVFAYSEVDAYFWGFEFESTFHVKELVDLGEHDLALDAQVDFTRARNDDDSENIPRIPPLRTIVRARYEWMKSFTAMAEGVFVESQDRVAPFELPTDSYAVLNAELSVKMPSKSDFEPKLFVRGSNLTDDEARVHSSFLKDLAPLRGRSLLLGVSAKF